MEVLNSLGTYDSGKPDAPYNFSTFDASALTIRVQGMEWSAFSFLLQL